MRHQVPSETRIGGASCVLAGGDTGIHRVLEGDLRRTEGWVPSVPTPTRPAFGTGISPRQLVSPEPAPTEAVVHTGGSGSVRTAKRLRN